MQVLIEIYMKTHVLLFKITSGLVAELFLEREMFQRNVVHTDRQTDTHFMFSKLFS